MTYIGKGVTVRVTVFGDDYGRTGTVTARFDDVLCIDFNFSDGRVAFFRVYDVEAV